MGSSFQASSQALLLGADSQLCSKRMLWGEHGLGLPALQTSCDLCHTRYGPTHQGQGDDWNVITWHAASLAAYNGRQVCKALSLWHMSIKYVVLE